MNRIYRLVWNRHTSLWAVASELARSRVKGGGSAGVCGGVALARSGGHFPLKRSVLAGAFGLLLGGVVQAADLPTGGQIVAGAGSISQNGSSLTVQQDSSKLIAHWQSFDIGAGHSVHFQQPSTSSVALNRVLGNNGSEIYGSLTANGQVFLINPNGILFAEGASVNVGGLVASTLDIHDEDFLNGHYRFTQSPDKNPDNSAGISNRGSITADGGAIALLGGTVSNTGLLQARLGSVVLAAGNSVTLDFAGDGLLSVQIDEGQLNALIENHGAIKADGGQVILTTHAADQLLNTVVNNSGLVQAQTVEERDGKIVLLADLESGTAHIAGTLDASAPTTGDGGFIETSGAKVSIADGTKITTKAEQGKTGTWLIDPQDFTIAASGGDISGATLSAQLADNDITIQSVNGATAGNGDIFVNDSITWSQNTLTLSAERNIEIHAEQHASGTAGLALEYGQANLESGNTATYSIKAPVNLASTSSFSTKLGSDGTTLHYTIITELGNAGDELSAGNNTLQGLAHSSNLSGHYVLGANIDATPTASWNAEAGFSPIGKSGSGSNDFRGIFDGLGHTVDHLVIKRSAQSNLGLFGFIDGATLRNVGVQNADIRGSSSIGALVGSSLRSTISHAYASATVIGVSDAGGLVGAARRSVISDSHFTGITTALGSIGSGLGLAYAAVHAYKNAGGLVGYLSESTITNSHANSANLGSDSVGGLVGYAYNSDIHNSFATGGATGRAAPSYGLYNIGGLVGRNSYSDIVDSYAAVAVHGAGASSTGGLVGAHSGGHIVNSYSIGRVSNSNAGGLIGAMSSGTVTDSYWATDASGRSSSAGGTGLTLVQLQAALPAGFDPAIWGNANDQSTPYLLSTSRHVAAIVTDPGQNRVYDMILTAEQLQGMQGGLNGNYALGGNIDASVTAGWNNGLGFAPIGDNSSNSNASRFSGIFDGLGFTISGLTIDRPDTHHVGLFGYTSGATIRNVGLTGGRIGGWNYVGTVAGRMHNGTITNTYASSRISGDMSVGGLVGHNEGGTIASSYGTGAVHGVMSAGGLVGTNAGTITNAYAAGAVDGLLAGGLVGSNSGVIRYAYATGVVTDSFIGDSGLVASNSGTVTSAYWATDATGQSGSSGGGTGLTLAQLQAALPSGFNSSIWANGNNASTPYLKGLSLNVGYLASDPGTTNQYRILGDIAAVQSIANDLSGHYALAWDIDASATANWHGGAGFKPIGNNTNYFSGVLNGLGYTISSLTINRPDEDFVGLFGYVARGAVQNLGLANADITGRSRVGSLVGYLNNGRLSAVSSLNVRLNAGGDYAGGLVGISANQARIEHAGVTGDSEVGGENFVGGLVGYAHSNSPILSSWAYVTVSGRNQVGGLLGYNNGVLVEDGAAWGTVNASGTYVGGLVGVLSNGGSIVSGIADVDVSSPEHYVGGLVGYVDLGTTVENSFATGAVSGLHRVGGLVAYNRGTIHRSWAYGDVTATGTYIGGLVGVNASSGVISESAATGNVGSTQHYVGGLVGYNHVGGVISDVIATGVVNGISRVGGLIGWHGGSLANGLSIGLINAGYYYGGLIGFDGGGSVTASFWDVDTSGQTASAGGTGLDTETLWQMGTYSAAGWNIGTGAEPATIWRIDDGGYYPLLGFLSW